MPHTNSFKTNKEYYERLFGRRDTPKKNPNAQAVMDNAKAHLGEGVYLDDVIENILAGKIFFSDKKDAGNKYIGLADALEQAEKYLADNIGYIANLPILIAGKTTAPKKHSLTKNCFTAYSEENAGIDKKGKLVSKGEGIVLVVHGGGILQSSKRIFEAYSLGFTPQFAAKYTQEEFDDLLEGKLPSGKIIQFYTVDDVKNGNVPNPYGETYGIWLSAEDAKETISGGHNKIDFMNNELVLARAGTVEYLDRYFEKVKDYEMVGNHHQFNEIDFSQPQGRALLLSTSYDGLLGFGGLNKNGRFVVVAPEAHR